MRVLRYTTRPGDVPARWLRSPVLVAYLLAHTVIGAAFWIMARLQDEAFNAGTFGTFALEYPAEVWAAAMMTGSLVCLAGVAHPPRPWAVIAGSIINLFNFAGLGYSAIFTGGEPVVGLYASVMFAPMALYTMIAAVLANDAE